MEEGLREYSVSRVRVGEILTGKVITVSEKELAVNVGYRSDGIVPAAELPDESTANYKQDDDIEVMVISTDDGEGNLRLSVVRAFATVVWDEFQALVESQENFFVDVKEAVKGGVVAKYKGARVFIPASQVAAGYVADLSEFVGKKLEVRMVEVDKSKHRAVASAKAISAEKVKAARKEAVAKLSVGAVISGKVVRLEQFGAFIDLGGCDGLLHISNMSWKRIKHPSEVLKVGDIVKVEVTKVDVEKENVSLRLLDMPENPWNTVDSRYKVGGVYKGVVARLQNFGAFINLEEDVDGLCHVSEISVERIAQPSDVLKAGDEVEVKVLAVDKAEKRISLSIKAVNAPEITEAAAPVETVKSESAAEPVELGIKPTTLADVFKDVFKK